MFVAPTLYDDVCKGFLTSRIDVFIERITDLLHTNHAHE